MIKVGNKLHCKKELRLELDIALININSSYDIIRIYSDSSIHVNTELGIWSFNTNKQTIKNYPFEKYVWDYFYSTKELRLLKLTHLINK
jgi:hypothetical protein